MKKLFWVLILIIALFLCFFIAKLTVFYDAEPDTEQVLPAEETVAAETQNIENSAVPAATPSITPSPEPTATPEPMTEEEYDEMIQQEIEEIQQEDPLIDEHGEEVPTLDISGEEEIIIGDTEGAGSL